MMFTRVFSYLTAKASTLHKSCGLHIAAILPLPVKRFQTCTEDILIACTIADPLSWADGRGDLIEYSNIEIQEAISSHF